VAAVIGLGAGTCWQASICALSIGENESQSYIASFIAQKGTFMSSFHWEQTVLIGGRAQHEACHYLGGFRQRPTRRGLAFGACMQELEYPGVLKGRGKASDYNHYTRKGFLVLSSMHCSRHVLPEG